VTSRRRALLATAGVASIVATAGCSPATSSVSEHDLGSAPDSSETLGGTADGADLQVFSAFFTVDPAGAERFTATLLYTGPGSDRLVGITATGVTTALAQPLTRESARPISVPLAPTPTPPVPNRNVDVSLRLAGHGALHVSVPVVAARPASPGPTS
jgi:hypothetical protein